jgi:DNA-binding NtrC family response regulator
LKVDFTYDQNPLDRDHGPTVLIVDDELAARKRVRFLCGTAANSLRVLDCDSIARALEIIANTPVHVVLLDKDIGAAPNTGIGHNGIEAIPQFLALQPHLQILVITGSKQIQDAVRAMELGACGYVTKETHDGVLTAQIQREIHVARLFIAKNRAEAAANPEEEVRLVGSSAPIRQLEARIQAVAESSRPLLLLGESGTGKTTIAKMIHAYRRQYLKQKDRPFFALNLSAMPRELVERELFGNEAGAYTGALKTKQGFFELVNNGTLFLDEIGDISSDLQVKLLKVIEEGTFRRVGGTQELRSTFRLICATNRDLESMVARGEFREDLFRRISTFIIHVPNLEARREDIPALIQSLLPRCCRENNVWVTFDEVPKSFLQHLMKNVPMGNIRGLEQQLSWLLAYSPKDKRGRPMLKDWDKIREITSNTSRAPSTRTTVTLKDLTDLPWDVIGPQFPGLKQLMALASDKVIEDARKKSSTAAQAAKLLKVSAATLSLRQRKPKDSQSERIVQ